MFTNFYYFPTEKCLNNHNHENFLPIERQYRLSMYNETKKPMKEQIKINAEQNLDEKFICKILILS